MADVARAAGVSQQTVSRVANGLPNVNEQTRQRVQAAMQELGFRPSYAGRSLRDGRYHSVGLCVNDVTKFGNLSMIDGIASAAREHNCAITLVEMSKTEEFSLAEATRRMAALPVDGIIIGMSRMAPDFAFSCNSSCNKHATIKSELHLCVFCDRCPMSINACNEAGKAKLTVAVSIRVLGFVSPTGIGWKVTKVPRAPMLPLERSRAVRGALSCSPWVLL